MPSVLHTTALYTSSLLIPDVRDAKEYNVLTELGLRTVARLPTELVSLQSKGHGLGQLPEQRALIGSLPRSWIGSQFRGRAGLGHLVDRIREQRALIGSHQNKRMMCYSSK